jgi:DNA-binding MarR family transcriptional regulator
MKHSLGQQITMNSSKRNDSSLKSIYPFGFDRPEDSPGFSLWQTTILWQRKIKKALEKYDISHACFVIIATLYWFETKKCETTQIMISKWSKLDKMTVSKSIKLLVTKKLVQRQEAKQDSRAYIIHLSDQGKELVRKLVPMVEQIDAEFFSKLKPAEHDNFLSCLNQLVNKNSD